MRSIRVLLADDHVLMRSGIRSLLQAVPGVKIIGEAGDGSQALALIASGGPDLALVDIAMPGLSGFDVTAEAARKYPQVRIIILSMHTNPEYVRRALRAGAKGYLRKDANVEELRCAVETVVAGGIYLDRQVSQQIAVALSRGDAKPPGELDPLTPRLREVLKHLAEGRRTKEIARELKIGVRTVETYRSQLMERLDIHDLAGLVRYAIQIGLIAVQDGPC